MVVVDSLIIGATHLNHVPLLVISDANGAFSVIPSDQHGILGIQPLLTKKADFQDGPNTHDSSRTEAAISTVPIGGPVHASSWAELLSDSSTTSFIPQLTSFLTSLSWGG
jgi:hypothetical protein